MERGQHTNNFRRLSLEARGLVARQHDLWQVAKVKDFWLSSASVGAIGSLIRLDWIAGSGQIGRLAAGSRHRDGGECILAER